MIIDPLYAFVFGGQLFSPGANVILVDGFRARFGFRTDLAHVLGARSGVGITPGLTAFGNGRVVCWLYATLYNCA